jgi:tetratricopeptide (TPR) repeat protein
MNSNAAGGSNSSRRTKTSRPRGDLRAIGADFRRRRAGKARKSVHRRGLPSLMRDSLTMTVALVSTIALLVVCAVIIGLVLRRREPKTLITVSEFQIFPGDRKSNEQSGKALADLFIDELHRVLEKADRFHGNRFSSSKAFGGVPDMPYIPVDTSYGIEIKGVSLDQLVATWRRIRYQEYRISGDLITSTKGQYAILMRYDTEGRANSFDAPLPRIDPETLNSVVKALTLKLVKDINPEAAARYLSAVAMDSCERDCEKAWEPAVQFCFEWTEKEPGKARPFFYLGYALRHTKRPADSLTFLEHSLQLDPHLYFAYNTEGVELLNAGKFPEAESKFRAGLNIRKTSNGLVNLGVSARRKGQFEAAANYIRQALALEPDDFGAYLQLGYAQLLFSKNMEAADTFLYAHYLQPENQSAFWGRLVSLANTEKREQAVMECEEASRLYGLPIMTSSPPDATSDKCAYLLSWMLASTQEVLDVEVD